MPVDSRTTPLASVVAVVAVAVLTLATLELDLLCGFSGHSPDRNRPGRDGVQQVPFFRGRHRAGLNQLLDNDEDLFQSRGQESLWQAFTPQDVVLEFPVISLGCRLAEPFAVDIAVERSDELLRRVAIIRTGHLPRLTQLARQSLLRQPELPSG